MIKRLIFDIDGTLICGVDFTDAVSKTLQKFDIYSSENVELVLNAMLTYENVYNNYIIENYLKHISKYLGIKLDKDFMRLYFEELKTVVNYNDKEILIKKIDELSKRYELVLLSNYFEESQRSRLKTLGVDDYFTEYYGEIISKPDINVFLLAKGKHKIEECVMIGDSKKYDVTPAKSIGMPVIQVGKDIKTIEEIDDEIICRSLKLRKLNY